MNGAQFLNVTQVTCAIKAAKTAISSFSSMWRHCIQKDLISILLHYI